MNENILLGMKESGENFENNNIGEGDEKRPNIPVLGPDSEGLSRMADIFRLQQQQAMAAAGKKSSTFIIENRFMDVV